MKLIPAGIDLCQHDAEVLLERKFTQEMQVEGLAEPIASAKDDA
jgi:hypothetical protein